MGNIFSISDETYMTVGIYDGRNSRSVASILTESKVRAEDGGWISYLSPGKYAVFYRFNEYSCDDAVDPLGIEVMIVSNEDIDEFLSCERFRNIRYVVYLVSKDRGEIPYPFVERYNSVIISYDDRYDLGYGVSRALEAVGRDKEK